MIPKLLAACILSTAALVGFAGPASAIPCVVVAQPTGEGFTRVCVLNETEQDVDEGNIHYWYTENNPLFVYGRQYDLAGTGEVDVGYDAGVQQNTGGFVWQGEGWTFAGDGSATQALVGVGEYHSQSAAGAHVMHADGTYLFESGGSSSESETSITQVGANAFVLGGPGGAAWLNQREDTYSTPGGEESYKVTELNVYVAGVGLIAVGQEVSNGECRWFLDDPLAGREYFGDCVVEVPTVPDAPAFPHYPE